MRIDQLNERGDLRWVDGECGQLRFHYRNRFYGECNLRVRVAYGPQNLPSIDDDSVSVEQTQPSLRGERLLRQAALRFLRQAMLSQPELFQLRSGEEAESATWWGRLSRRWRPRTSSLSIKA